MTEEDLIIIEHLAPYLADTLRNEKPDSTAYKAAMKTVGSPEFQARMDVLRTHEYTVTTQGIVISDTPTNNEPTNWGAVIGILLGSIALLFVIIVLILRLLIKVIGKRKKDTVYVCTCTKCKNTREEKYENVFKGLMGGMTRYSEKYKMKKSFGVGIGTAYFGHYQKKIYCPTCNKKTWHEIENINDVMYDGLPTLKEARDRMFEKEMNKQ